MVSGDYTNINSNNVAGRYTSDTIEYDDANLTILIEKVDHAHTLITETFPSSWNQVKNHDSLWEGQSKIEYEELNLFIKQYQEDFAVSIADYKTSIHGIKELLDSLSEANVIKEIDAR